MHIFHGGAVIYTGIEPPAAAYGIQVIQLFTLLYWMLKLVANGIDADGKSLVRIANIAAQCGLAGAVFIQYFGWCAMQAGGNKAGEHFFFCSRIPFGIGIDLMVRSKGCCFYCSFSYRNTGAPVKIKLTR